MKRPDLPSFLSGRTRAGLALLSPATGRKGDSRARGRRRNASTDDEARAYLRCIKERQALYRTMRKR